MRTVIHKHAYRKAVAGQESARRPAPRDMTQRSLAMLCLSLLLACVCVCRWRWRCVWRESVSQSGGAWIPTQTIEGVAAEHGAALSCRLFLWKGAAAQLLSINQCP